MNAAKPETTIDCLVIGAGVTGLATALALLDDGREVTIIDQGLIGKGASHGNCGTLTPSHAPPLAGPSTLQRAARWMFTPDAPLYIKPTLNPDTLRWMLGFALLLPGLSFAADFTVNDGDTVTAKISRDGLTRVTVQGARIEQVFSADGKDLTFQVDKQNGQVFVRYKGGKEKVLDAMELPGGGSVKRKQTTGSGKQDFAAFVTDDGGRTFTLNLSVTDDPSASIVLKPMVVEKAKSGRVVIQNDLSLPSEVMALMQVMTGNVEEVSGYDVARDLSEPQTLWAGADYLRVASYEGDSLLGEVYTLTNRSGSQMRIVESEFQGKGVLAVAVKNPILEANEFTYVYTVREVTP